ncbi:MAG: nucleotidyltransferase family protein [Cyanobacteriota bacterium]|nr:nucleotidyltransferase family protein [Cyanobacteriota bacterium]
MQQDKPSKNYSFLKENRQKIIDIAARHGAYNIRIFGSVARGEADEKSDIDFLVDYSIDRISSWFPAGLVLELERFLECKVDVATEPSLKQRIRDRVLNEAIPL